MGPFTPPPFIISFVRYFTALSIYQKVALYHGHGPSSYPFPVKQDVLSTCAACFPNGIRGVSSPSQGCLCACDASCACGRGSLWSGNASFCRGCDGYRCVMAYLVRVKEHT
jgi:hypothetical protein